MNTILDELLEVLPGATRYSGYLSSLCPFHEDQRPSFMVWEDRYRCYACGVFGRSEDLLSIVGNRVRVQPETRFYNPWRKWIRQYGRIGLAMKEAHANLPQSYLERRGICDIQQCKFKLGFLDDWYTIPFFDRYGTIIGGIARRGEGNSSIAKYVTPPQQNNRHLLYVPDWGLVEQQREIIVTFGIFDAITLAINGIAAASIIGLFVDPSVFDFLRKAIYIVPDRKEEKFALELASRLGWRGHVLRIDYPEGCKDLNDIYIKEPQHVVEIFKDMRHDAELAGLFRGSGRLIESEKNPI